MLHSSFDDLYSCEGDLTVTKKTQEAKKINDKFFLLLKEG